MSSSGPSNCAPGSGHFVSGNHSLPPLTPAQTNASPKIKDGWVKIANSFLDSLDQGVQTDLAMQMAMNQIYSDPDVNMLAYLDFLSCPGGGDCLKNVLQSLKDSSQGNNKDSSHGDNKAAPAKPQGTATVSPPFVTAGRYCEPDLDNPERKICWQKASNGSCKKWRENAAGKILNIEPSFPEDDGFSDTVFNTRIYNQSCPDGATKAYNDSIKGVKIP